MRSEKREEKHEVEVRVRIELKSNEINETN